MSIDGILKKGEELKRFCRHYKDHSLKRYPRWGTDGEVKAMVGSNLQYFLIMETISNIASLSKQLNLMPMDYQRLTEAVTNQSCSANLTFLKSSEILREFEKGFAREVESSFSSARERLGIAINRFKQVCSWDGREENYRLLSWFISDAFTYTWLLNKMKASQKMVFCKEGVCGPIKARKFRDRYPLMIGSMGLEEDWRSLYCKSFRFATHDKRKQPSIIKKWIDEFFPNRSLYLVDLISHITKRDIPIREGKLNWDDLLKSYTTQIQDDWKRKSEKILGKIVGQLKHEEPLVLVPLKAEGQEVFDKVFGLDILVSAGEIDKSMGSADKLLVTLKLKFPEKFFHWFKRELSMVSPKEKVEFENLKKKVLKYIEKSLEEKKEFFSKAPWEGQLKNLLADIFMRRFNKIKMKNQAGETGPGWSTLEIRLHFGLFALKHLYEMGPDSDRKSIGIDFQKKRVRL